jgi:histidine triad (HIT) family protein
LLYGKKDEETEISAFEKETYEASEGEVPREEKKEKKEIMSECIFCKIVKGEVPCHTIWEDDDVVAFLDSTPINKGHTLVIPKKHVENIFTLSVDDLDKIMHVVQKIALALRTICEGINIGQNNNAAAGQVVPHVHFHVIPRFSGDGLRHWTGKAYREGEAEKVAENIKSQL